MFASVLVAVPATAIGLGPATLSSGLGEPLRLSIPVTLQPDEDVGCVQVRSHGDDLPTVYNTRSQVLHSGTRTRIEIQSAQAIDEPAIGLVVSVGCASPVARDYVLFLDPPFVAATAPTESAIAAGPIVTTPAPRAARARAYASDTASASAGRPARPPRPAHRRASPPVVATSRADSPTPNASLPKASAPARSTPARASSSGDRLSVMPTEPPVIGRTSPSPQPGVYPPVIQSAAPSASGTTGTAAAVPPVVAAVAAAAAVPPAVATATPAAGAPPGEVPAPTSSASASTTDAQAREEALRQQQALLQSQIKSLADQIALLRIQTTSLAARNQALEASAFSPTLVWLLIALAVIAIVVAAWMAWRYAQLRRSLEGSAWWAGQTVGEGTVIGNEPQPAGPGPAVADGATRSMSRTAATGAESRSRTTPAATTSPSSSAQVSNIDRIRPAVRAPGSSYPAAMDTDFTVSDIEAAMATVRTVSPARPDKAPNPLEDSDFSGLGGPTITSPFSDEPLHAQPQEPSVSEDHMAHFVDLEIPAATPLTAAPSAEEAPGAPSIDVPARAQPPAFEPFRGTDASPPPAIADPVPDLDFRFEVPKDFDPLASDSLKTTIIDRPDPVAADFPGAPTALDFELPSQTQILSMGFDRGVDGNAPRHGATALDDLFAPGGSNLHDTVLEVDGRDGTPLSGTEVDRLTSPDLDADSSLVGLSGRRLLVRVADLMTRIDEIATIDPLSAIASLRQYVLRDEHVPTLMWLRLFELYKIVDKRQVHDALAEHFARRYHRPMVGWTETLADRTPQRPLAALTRLDQEIEAQWGSEAGLLHLEHLLCDRTEEDAIVFNAVLQRDLLDAAKIYPDPAEHGASGAQAAGTP